MRGFNQVDNQMGMLYHQPRYNLGCYLFVYRVLTKLFQVVYTRCRMVALLVWYLLYIARGEFPPPFFV